MKTKTYKEFVKESEEVNEKKVMDLDVLLMRFQDSDYSPSNSSLKDLENFIDFIREYTPKGTIIESEEVNEAKTVSYDDVFAELTDGSHDYEVNYRSHTDIQEFIDFLRSYYPKGTKFE